MPAPPGAGSHFNQALGYWNCLMQLIVYRLGWRHPGPGLQWWYDAGQPDDTVELAMLKAVWARDVPLEGLIALDEGSGPHLVPGPLMVDRTAEPLSREWTVRLENAKRSHRVPRRTRCRTLSFAQLTLP